jgi:hypothetical protein
MKVPGVEPIEEVHIAAFVVLVWFQFWLRLLAVDLQEHQ